MQRHEWLSLAQKVPVGQSRRFYHGAESRPNLKVWNKPDSWSCYCHACHEGATVYKEVLQRVTETPVVLQKYLSSTDCCTLPELARLHPQRFKRLVVLLHKKRMSTALIAPWKPVYNLTDDRLVFTFGGCSIGRDCTERSHAKWFHYYSQKPMDFLYLQGENTHSTREPIVLTEDLFSAMKVQQYTGLSALCCFGTLMQDSIIAFLVDPSSAFYPVLAFDGDSAGRKATQDAKKRLGIRGVSYYVSTVPEGCDPKDLSPIELNELFKEVL